METVSPFNLILNVALSSVPEFAASLTPTSKKEEGRRALRHRPPLATAGFASPLPLHF
jgi:hypothetical protein